MTKAMWRPILAPRAVEDLSEIVDWTSEQFGVAQADAYLQVILASLDELACGPSLAGIKKRDDLLPGLMTLHVARHGHRGRHILLFRVAPGSGMNLEILRILHDQMDIVRHISPEE